MVYSASVFHVIADDSEFGTYLANAWSVLRPGGIFFGSTLGQVGMGTALSPGGWGPPRVMTGEQWPPPDRYRLYLPEIVQRHHVPHYIADNRCVFEFCTKKPA